MTPDRPTPGPDLAAVARQIEVYLLAQRDWVPVVDLVVRFGIRERLLRADDGVARGGLLDGFAVSSPKGFKHASLVTTDEWLAIKHRLQRHAVAEIRKLRTWVKARRNCLQGPQPSLVERHSGQLLLPLPSVQAVVQQSA